ncbi:hypothetical protein DT076_00965 [Desertihabitans brevis]|uniref:Nucleotidyltransferase domain-containing protein n=1 Tax=Desertihabitans brevis TaxID=2268447 RepID=A0A367YZE5_9ACTN|nr:hypothetical protein DT076_00965 [Desertihabitans brevis]
MLVAELEEARRDAEVLALLLTGSVARRDALPGTDLDLRVLVRTDVAPAFTRSERSGVLVERGVTTARTAHETLLADPMHVYAYVDGIALHDPDGALARLRAEAERLRETYRTPPERRDELAEALSHPEEKIRTACAAGDLPRATYALATASWQLIEALWAANDLPLPPNASVRPHLRDLRGPADVEHRFDDLFMTEPVRRVETGLALLAWIRGELTRPR